MAMYATKRGKLFKAPNMARLSMIVSGKNRKEKRTIKAVSFMSIVKRLLDSTV